MMRCIPCSVGDKDQEHPDCEAKHGSIMWCDCPACFPPGAATQAPGESDSAYAGRLLREHGHVTTAQYANSIEREREADVQMSLESAELPPRQHRKPADVDTKGRL